MSLLSCSTLTRVEPNATNLAYQLVMFIDQLAVPSLGSSPTQLKYSFSHSQKGDLAVPSLGSSPTQRCSTARSIASFLLAVPSLGSSPTQRLYAIPIKEA